MRTAVALAACAALAVLAACTPGATVVPPSPAPMAVSPSGPAPTTPAPSPPPPSPTPSAWPPPATGAPSDLAPGSDPSVLPGPVLVADKGNNRLVVISPQGQVLWQWPQPGDLAPGQTFVVPDDVFVTPDGRQIVTTQEDDFVVTVIDIATRRIVWRYGTPGRNGSGPGQLWNPDDAMMLPDGTVIAADIKNCRIVDLAAGAPAPVWTLGGSCGHAPPARFGSPNGVFPLANGHFLVTEINGDWVDEIDRAGRVAWSAHPPAVAYPSDSSGYRPGQYVTADYSNPGQVVVFDQAGRTVWRWNPVSGAGRLNHPSLAEGLPNGDILLNDDGNHRILVLDPSSDRIVWQYGHTGQAGAGPGFLDTPDGLDPVPPASFADRVGLTKPPAGAW